MITKLDPFVDPQIVIKKAELAIEAKKLEIKGLPEVLTKSIELLLYPPMIYEEK